MEESAFEPEKDKSQAHHIGPAGNRVFWLMIFCGLIGLIVFLSVIWLGKQGIESAKDAVVEIAKEFNPDKIVETFDEWRELEAIATEGNILEIATATATEKFTRQTNIEMFGTTLPLGTTVSEIQVTATYRYHIELNGKWCVSTDGNRLLVVAPPISPSLPVAFDTGTVQKRSTAGWARWDSQENLDELEKEITGKLALRAADPLSISKVYDQGSLAVAKFVRHWLESQGAWDTKQFKEIVIAFYGEDLAGQSLSSRPSILRINESDEILLP
jgi:hypothetical protein